MKCQAFLTISNIESHVTCMCVYIVKLWMKKTTHKQTVCADERNYSISGFRKKKTIEQSNRPNNNNSLTIYKFNYLLGHNCVCTTDNINTFVRPHQFQNVCMPHYYTLRLRNLPIDWIFRAWMRDVSITTYSKSAYNKWSFPFHEIRPHIINEIYWTRFEWFPYVCVCVCEWAVKFW